MACLGCVFFPALPHHS